MTPQQALRNLEKYTDLIDGDKSDEDTIARSYKVLWDLVLRGKS